MLEAHESPGLIAERRLVVSDGVSGAPEYVGPYRIDALIGAGGMGDVYRAERADGAYRQTVALKVLRLGYRTNEMVRRFRIEREALARLAHPGIATILDGGTLEDGRPYIVLEFVQGVPVTGYCAEHRLTLEDRLALFLRIVSAVQFAHGRLVIHRDLKPSNILVQADGMPRLLDFGIAKLLDVGADASLATDTSTEGRLLTPEYAAPEQIRGEQPTTATDVYALGVLLFELLTGSKPFPAAGRTLPALERAVLDTAPPTPSGIVDAPVGSRRLRGDLDRIVLMALRKEPDRRYTSAGQLGEDVERYLSGRPVMARPDSVGYRARKFVGRNRALVAAVASIALLLVGFATTATLQARRVSRERDRAQRERVAADEVLSILTRLFERGDPNKHPGGDPLRVTSL
ncbi:MAG: serine/threonine-protein kinase, partial [bacterium]